MVQVKIFGKEYRVRSDVSVEHLEQVADYVDRTLREVGCRTPDTQDAAVLAALNIASDLLRLRALEAVPRERVQELIDLIDSV